MWAMLSPAGEGRGENSPKQDSRIEPLNRTTATSPSPPDVGGRRGPGRGGFDFAGRPLSPTLSLLVPSAFAARQSAAPARRRRGERETIRARSVQVHGEVLSQAGQRFSLSQRVRARVRIPRNRIRALNL